MDEQQRALLIRWTLINAAGWFAGLIAGGFILGVALLLALIAPSPLYLLSLVLAGAALGAVVSYIQRSLLNDFLDETELRQWLYFSAGGGALGTVLALIGAWLSGLGWLVGAAAVGALLSGSVATGQWFILRRYIYPARRWIWIHLVGGALCGVITLFSNGGLGLPICCCAGTLVFGGLIASMLRQVMDIGNAEFSGDTLTEEV